MLLYVVVVGAAAVGAVVGLCLWSSSSSLSSMFVQKVVFNYTVFQ